MTTVPDRVARFEADIAAGPDALAHLLDAWRPIDLRGRGRIAFTGLGSSRYAALIAASAVRARGTTAWVEYASSATPTRPAADLVLIAISASGGTPEVIEAARRHRGTSHVIAVTNDPASGLAEAADVVVPLGAGAETSGIACRTYRATVAALALLTGLAGAGDLRPVVEALAGRHASRDAWLPPIVDALDRAPAVDVLADASLLGLAEQAALMLREAPRLPATAYDTGDWLHTGVYLAFGDRRAVVIPGAPADAEAIDTVTRRGGRVARLEPADGDPIARALVESVVAELAAAALWARTDAHDKGT